MFISRLFLKSVNASHFALWQTCRAVTQSWVTVSCPAHTAVAANRACAEAGTAARSHAALNSNSVCSLKGRQPRTHTHPHSKLPLRPRKSFPLTIKGRWVGAQGTHSHKYKETWRMISESVNSDQRLTCIGHSLWNLWMTCILPVWGGKQILLVQMKLNA